MAYRPTIGHLFFETVSQKNKINQNKRSRSNSFMEKLEEIGGLWMAYRPSIGQRPSVVVVVVVFVIVVVAGSSDLPQYLSDIKKLENTG